MIHETPVFKFRQGTLPLLISIPHLGTEIPPGMEGSMADIAAVRQDTDWHLDRLYSFAVEMGASILQAKVSRYVIDVNRPPDGHSLYPGQTTTGLVPTETFRGEPLHRPGWALDADEKTKRLQLYWQPYHDQLRSELDRLIAKHGAVLLWDAHSIASRLPRLFDGQLPDLNFGTADGRSCASHIIDAVVDVARNSPFTHVVNGRFKGGHITRHYAAPSSQIHAIQLEMSQQLYMNEAPPFDYLPEKAAQVQTVLYALLDVALRKLIG